MTKNQVVQEMLKELDWLVKFYKEMESESDRQEIELEYKHFASAYNHLLGNMYKKHTLRFPRKIERFITNRESFEID